MKRYFWMFQHLRKLVLNPKTGHKFIKFRRELRKKSRIHENLKSITQFWKIKKKKTRLILLTLYHVPRVYTSPLSVCQKWPCKKLRPILYAGPPTSLIVEGNAGDDCKIWMTKGGRLDWAILTRGGVKTKQTKKASKVVKKIQQPAGFGVSHIIEAASSNWFPIKKFSSSCLFVTLLYGVIFIFV